MPQTSRTPSPVAPPRVRLDFLDGLRALAAVYVILYHATSYQWLHLSGHTLKALGPLCHGHEAVDLFIVLSGFSLMLPIARGDGTLRGGAGSFFQRRAWRILPPYYAALALCLLLDWTLLSHKTGSIWDNFIPVTVPGILSHLALVQDVFPSTSSQIDSPMWSVAVEWRIYFCFPLLVLAWPRLGPWATTALAFAVAAVFQFALTHVSPLTQLNSGITGLSPQYLGLFALGMLGASLAFSQDARLTALRRRTPWGAVAFATAMLAAVGIHALPDNLFWTDVLVGVCAVSVIVTAALRDGALRRILSWRPLVRVGTFSYSLYLLHFPCLQFVWQYLVHPLRLTAPAELAAHILVGVPFALCVAYAFHLAFEKPFLVRRKNETLAEVACDAALSPAP